MAVEFIMPKLGLTMEEGTILEWLIEDGTEINQGTAVLRIETDKVESDVESPTSGRFHRTGESGQTYPCGAVIGYFLAEGEQAPAPSAAPAGAITEVVATTPTPNTTIVSTAPRNGRLLASPNARRIAEQLGIDVNAIVGSGPQGRVLSEDVEEFAANPVLLGVAAPTATILSSNGHVLATPAARQLADLLGIDLALVPYDSTDGRITKDGVAAFVRQKLTANQQSTSSSVAPLAASSQIPTSVKKMSGMRNTIAKRMHSSLQEMAQLTLMMDADLDAIVQDRDRRKGAAVIPGFTDYVVAAAARALRLHPIANSQLTQDGIALLPDIHIGLAVGLDGGLIVPVIRNTDHLDLISLAEETKRLAIAARAGKLTVDDLNGGTFSVSALGMFGVDGFTPVINPPNAAILGVGRLRDDLTVSKKGKVHTVKRLTLSLTWDHRIFDGVPAAQFCRSIVELLGDPVALNN